MILLKCEHDYADEFDTHGFTVISEKEWEKYQETLKYVDYPYEHYFGTNEAIIFDSYEDVTYGITVSKISEAENEILKKFFSPPNSDLAYFGVVPILDFPDHLSDEDYKRIWEN